MVIRKLTFLFVLVCANIAFAQPTQLNGPPSGGPPPRVDRREIEIGIGEQTSIPATNVANYSEGTPGIVDIRVLPNPPQFVIVGQRAGTTTLLLIMQDGRQINYRIYVRAPETNEGRIGERDNIRLDFYFVEVSDSYNHQLGIGWPPSVGAGATANVELDLTDFSLTSATASLSDQPLPRLDILQSTGWARIMKQASVITANGNTAGFESGGEVNVVTGGLNSSLAKVNFGTQVQIAPRYDSESGRIELRISAEFSELSEDRGTGVPGRARSNVDTVVNVRMGQSVALAGVVSESEAVSQTGLPGLSQIPVLGVLFGSNVNRSERTRNVVFIVPTIVDTVSDPARQQIREALRVFEEFDGDTDEVTLLRDVGDRPAAATPPSSTED